MASPLISQYSLIEFREYLVNNSTLGQIQNTFTAVGIRCGIDISSNVSGQRRQLVEQYYSSLDLTSATDLQKLLRAIEREVLQCRLKNPDTSAEILRSLLTVLGQDGYLENQGRIRKTTSPFHFQQVHIDTINSAAITQDWERMLNMLEEDPEDAITAARSLIESICKYILDELSVTYEAKWDLTKLYKTTSDALRLSPSGYDEQIFKQILGGCSSIAQGLAEIRNAYGDAHGKGKKHIRALPRHSRLAVNAACTLAVFLLETFEARGGQMVSSGTGTTT